MKLTKELVVKYKSTNEDKYIEKIFDIMGGFLHNKALHAIRTTTLPNYYYPDLKQEAMIEVWHSMKFYDPSKGDPWPYFTVVAENAMSTFIRWYFRQKHVPSGAKISLHKNIYGDDVDKELIDIIESVPDVKNTVIDNITYRNTRDKICRLCSNMEEKIFLTYLSSYDSRHKGANYEAIRDKTNYRIKQIDNALQRIRKKARKYLESGNIEGWSVE